MYGILPGFSNGVEGGVGITSAPGAVNDSITSIYCDYNFPLTNFAFTFPSTTQATVAPATTIVAGEPTNILAPGGLNVGDLLFFLVSTPGAGTAGSSQGTSSAQTAAVVAEITGLPNSTTVDFASGDALNFNQTGPNSLASTISSLGPALGGGNTVTVCRLNAVTYFLQVPAGGRTDPPPDAPSQRTQRRSGGRQHHQLAIQLRRNQFHERPDECELIQRGRIWRFPRAHSKSQHVGDGPEFDFWRK